MVVDRFDFESSLEEIKDAGSIDAVEMSYPGG